MSDNLLLSDTEVRDLTGRRRRTAQVLVLRAMGIEHRVRPDGTIAVSRAHVEMVLGGGIGGSVSARKTGPDFSGMGA